MPTCHPPIFDGHNDTLQALYLPHKQGRDLLQESREGHVDLVRARRGGLGGGLSALFVPSPGRGEAVDPEVARKTTELGMEALLDLERRAEGRLRVVRDLPALLAALEDDVFAAVMHFEGAEAVDPGLERLEAYYGRGLRSLGPVWSRPNAFGTGVDFHTGGSPDQGPGLTPEGKALVRACNRLGILVDLSHLNEKGFWDVAGITAAPLVATHSCVHRLSPSPRNLTDRQLDAIAASGGIVGIN
ncbi:MAG TPA: membrane dipeptidase, partial [Holophaga sp.]|nr:membrane dipeptidase [Holophaga sp.]